MKVYIVTSGDYDGYHIDEVFSTKEKAEEYIECFGDKCSIEEYSLDKPIEYKERTWRAMFDIENKELTHCGVENCYSINSVSIERYGNRIIFEFMASGKTKAIEIAKERLDNVIKNKDNKYKKLFVCKRNNWFSDLIDYNTGEIIE